MNAASLMVFVGALVALTLYGVLLIGLVSWLADRFPVQPGEVRPTRYRVTLMDRLRRRGFVRIAGKRYALYAADHAAVRFLRRLSRHRLLHLDKPDRWLRLVSFVSDFRRLHHDRPFAGLLWCLLHGDAEMQRLAAWLLGKRGEPSAVPALVRLAGHPQPRLRREAARSLRRLNAWAELRTIAMRETDPLVLRFTAQPPPKSFESRLSKFLAHDGSRV